MRKAFWFITAAWLFVTASALGQGREIFDLVVTQTGSVIVVVGDSRNPQCAADNAEPACNHVTFDIPQENWREFTNWPEKPVKGQILKGRWTEGQFQTVADCETRIRQARENACKATGYDCARLPMNSFVPEDCSAPHSEFINELLRRLR